MPLPQDERVVALANDLLAVFDQAFGYHPSFRAAHAKGVLLSGNFTPTKDAAAITKAEHMNRAVPVFMRFSNSTGIPLIPDNSPDASPRGAAVRFMLGEHRHTDIVSHSIDAFPNRDGYEFLEFFRAVLAGGATLDQFIAQHDATRAFVQAPKPFPTSFAREHFFAVSAFEFVNADGKSCFGRYRILPADGTEYLSADDAKSKDENFLMDEIATRVAQQPVRYRVVLQLAEQGDVVDNATIRWPETRKLIELGVIELTAVAPDNAAQQQRIIFDPIPRIDGINATADPLFELRAAIYLLSGRRRRAATPAST